MTVSALPGSDLITAGLENLERGEETVASLLVSIGASGLRRLGYTIARPFQDPERRLCMLLAASDLRAAHGRYNALVRRLVSVERAAAIDTHVVQLDGEPSATMTRHSVYSHEQ